MGYNARNDEIRDNITRMHRQWEEQRDALATVRRFNARLSAKGYSWFWPKIKAALVSKHHWLVIACDSCDSVVDLDLRVKPRDPEASIRVALRDVRCPRCNGSWPPAHHRLGAASVDLNLSRHGPSPQPSIASRPRRSLRRNLCLRSSLRSRRSRRSLCSRRSL